MRFEKELSKRAAGSRLCVFDESTTGATLS